MEQWQTVWRDGLAPSFSTAGLFALRTALLNDDSALAQGQTTSPPPLACVQDWPCEAADAIGYCGWKGENLTTVGEVEAFFAKSCFEADKRLGEPAGCRYFLTWYDDTPRDNMRSKLLQEIQVVLMQRSTGLSTGVAPATLPYAKE